MYPAWMPLPPEPSTRLLVMIIDSAGRSRRGLRCEPDAVAGAAAHDIASDRDPPRAVGLVMEVDAAARCIVHGVAADDCRGALDADAAAGRLVQSCLGRRSWSINDRYHGDQVSSAMGILEACCAGSSLVRAFTTRYSSRCGKGAKEGCVAGTSGPDAPPPARSRHDTVHGLIGPRRDRDAVAAVGVHGREEAGLHRLVDGPLRRSRRDTPARRLRGP